MADQGSKQLKAGFAYFSLDFTNINMDEETAKAVQKVAETGGKAIDLAQKVGGFLNKVAGGAFVELGGVVHDWAQLFRYRNLLRLQDRVEEIHNARKLQGKSIPVPPRYAIPLLQAASLEDEGSIQELWAGLIANATDPEKRLEPKKVFIDVLSAIEPIDARILQHLASQGWLMYRNVAGGGVSVAKLSESLGATEKDIRFSLQNLHRLGCIIDEYEATWDQISTTSFGQRISDPKTTFRPSPFAFSLLEACDLSATKTREV